MAKLRVAILHYSCPPVIGGVEFVIEAHARLFADSGYDTSLIVGKGGKVHPKVRTVVIPEISADGKTIEGVLGSLANCKVPDTFEPAVKRVEKKLAAALRGVDVCMMHNVLTMHFNMVLTAALANLMKRRRKTRFIGWTHDSTFGDSRFEKYQLHDRPWDLLCQELPGCDYCVISAQRQREISKLFGIPSSRLPVVPDGINVPELLGLTPVIADLFASEHLDNKEIVALTPTRIVRRKNLERGIEVVAALKKLGKNIRWMITGAPDPYNIDAVAYYKELVALRRKLRVEREVIFLCDRLSARVSNEDLRGLFAMSDMLIFPSRQEGFGIPALEGGLAGLVMVLSDIPALKEIAGRDAVYIRANDEPGAVAQRAVKALARNRQLGFRKKVIARYSWRSVYADKILPVVLDPDSAWGA